MKFGIDRLLADPDLRKPLEGKRIALVAHPASVTEDLTHSLDALIAAGVNVTSAFGPQHGLKGDKQDTMVETGDEIDPAYNIPVFSLYGVGYTPLSPRCSTCSRKRRGTARQSGCSTGPIPPDARSKAHCWCPATKVSSARAQCRCATG